MNPDAVVDVRRENWTCTLEGDLKLLFQKKTVGPSAK